MKRRVCCVAQLKAYLAIILSSSMPNLEAYMRANEVKVKAQPCRPAEKHTEPFSG